MHNRTTNDRTNVQIAYHGFVDWDIAGPEMAPSFYAARISRLVGSRKSTFFEVELVLPDRLPGQVPVQRMRVLIQEDPGAPVQRVADKARYVLALVAQAEWSVEDQADAMGQPPCGQPVTEQKGAHRADRRAPRL